MAAAATTQMFATCLPGLAGLLGRQLDELPGVSTTQTGADGRADIVRFAAARGHRDSALAMRTAEDIFAEIGRASRTGNDARRIAVALWRPQQVQRALSIWAEHRHPLTPSMTYRVVARVLTEQAFRRTELRRQLTEAIQHDRPRWSPADPADLEVWACEYRPGQFIAGLRLTDAGMRQHGGRQLERPGALRPTVAAAMARLAGEPGGALLDPCCGSGTIVAEALAAGWRALGADIDQAAVEIARRNVPLAAIAIGDALRMPFPDAAMAACVTNLPFGRQYQVSGRRGRWLTTMLAESARVTRPGGHVVLLAPGIPAASVPAALAPQARIPIRLLGQRAAIWSYRRLP